MIPFTRWLLRGTHAAQRARRRVAHACVALALAMSALVPLVSMTGCGRAAAPSATVQSHAARPARSAESATARAATSVRTDIGFRTRALLEEHFRKHGREFGGVNQAQYLRIAQELRDRPAGGDVLELVRGDGVVSRFDRRSGTFIAFNSNGVIRTCFRPSDGERYFRRQAMRYKGDR